MHRHKDENFEDGMNMDKKGKIQNEGGTTFVQTVNEESLKLEKDLPLETMENAISSVAKLKSESESFDNCKRDIKVEDVSFDEEYQEIEEQKVQIKSETKISDVDNMLFGDFVKNEIGEGTW